jgi:signal transduction histidine kinase
VIRARFSAASPDGLDGVGQSVRSGPSPSDTAAGSRGSYIAKSVVDHVSRLYSYLRVGNYPLVVTVGLDLDAELAPDRAYIITAFWRAAIATLVICAFFAYLARDIEGRAEREQVLALERNRLQEANAELERAVISRQHAESASRAKSLFLANMSHELRTPLNAIIGFSQIIRDEIMGPAGTSAYVSYAKDICGAGEHLLATINGILDISKIESGKFELRNEPVDLRDIIDTALAAVRTQAEKKRIAIETALPDGLPTVIADQLALRQVLINVLANAVKFTPETGHVGIRTEGRPDGAFAIVITDTGIGMSEDDMAVAFELFGQVENTMTKRHDGTGLGLPLARRLIELHGGAIELASRKDDGTTVRVILPAKRVVPMVIPTPVTAAA